MTTKELVQWVLDAEAELENSWNDDTKSYSHTQETAINATTPPRAGNISSTNPNPTEHEMALSLISNYWNECQEWIKGLK